MNKYAFLIRDDIPIFIEGEEEQESTGHRALYRLVPPYNTKGFWIKGIPEVVDYVVASAVLTARDKNHFDLNKCGKETLVFMSDSNGNVKVLNEIEGVTGTLSHAMVFSHMGYTLICDKQLED